MAERRLRIVFVVNTAGLTGGIRVVFEHANRLADRGHVVCVVHALSLVARRSAADTVLLLVKRAKFLLHSRVEWFDLRVPLLRVPEATDRWMPDADVVVATANETADWVAGLSDRKGRKFYLVQDVEHWTRAPALVDATYTLPLVKVVIAPWIAQHLEKLGHPAEGCVRNGVDTAVFVPGGVPAGQRGRPPVVLLMVHPLARKGTSDALAALAQVREAGVPFRLHLFGAYRPAEVPALHEPAVRSVVEDAVWTWRPTGAAVAALYRSADVFLSPSHAEGYHLPPMEAMASGCAVVATPVGSVVDVMRDGVDGLIVPVGDRPAFVAALRRLLGDAALCAKLGGAAREVMLARSWDRATAELEGVFLRRVAGVT